LALLKTELELALRHPRSREELEQTLQSAAEDTDRLVRLAEDLLLVARFDQGQLPIRPERLAARSVLERAVDRFAARAAEHGRSAVAIVLPRSTAAAPGVRAEPRQLAQRS